MDARFAPYIAGFVAGGRREGFVKSWQKLKGQRIRVFILFLIFEGATALARLALPEWRQSAMDLTLSVADFEGFLGLPQGSLVARIPDTVEFIVYVVVSNALCAGAILALHRRMIELNPERRAAIFD